MNHNWFDGMDRYYTLNRKYNNDVFMAKMWIAEEMVKSFMPHAYYYNSDTPPGNEGKVTSWITQFLKKEWFR